jgi:hypothetical protein
MFLLLPAWVRCLSLNMAPTLLLVLTLPLHLPPVPIHHLMVSILPHSPI